MLITFCILTLLFVYCSASSSQTIHNYTFVESHVITTNKTKTIFRFNKMFPKNEIPMYYWDPPLKVNGCPTTNYTSWNDNANNKRVSVNLAHFNIWQDIAYRYRKNPNHVAVIFEEDAQCAIKNCGEIAYQEIRSLLLQTFQLLLFPPLLILFCFYF